MSHRKNRLGVFGSALAVVVLGVMAFASMAQAVTAEFVIGGTLVPAGLNAAVNGEQKGIGTLLVPNLKIEIKCEKFTVQEGHIVSSTDALGKLLYENCRTYELEPPLNEISNCHIVVNNSTTVPPGDYKLHIQATALILPVHIGGNDFAVLAENISALVLYLKGVGCALPTHALIKGEVCGLIDGNETEKPLLLFSKAIQESCPEVRLNGNPVEPITKDKLLYGTNEAFIDAEAHVFLAGVNHVTKTLGVLLF